MKNFLISLSVFILLCCTTIQLISQTAPVLKTDAVSFQTLDSATGKWSAWSEFSPVHVVVRWVVKENAYKIYTDEIQTYTVLYYYSPTSTEVGDHITGAECVDESGSECMVLMILSEKKKQFIQINYQNAKILYRIIN